MTNKLFIPKYTGTYSEALEAFGLAVLLEHIVKSKSKVTIEDLSSSYSVITDETISFEMLKECEFSPKVKYLIGKDDKKPTDIINCVELKKQYEISKNYWSFINPKGKNKKKPTEEEIERYKENNPTNDADWDIISQIVNLDALPTYKKCLDFLIDNKKCFSEILTEIFRLYDYDNGVDLDRDNSSIQRLKKILKTKKIDKVTAVKIFNPSSIKGVNRLKADKISSENIEMHPLQAWLQIIGAYNGMIIKSVNIGSRKKAKWKDLKSFVVSPAKIEFDWITKVYKGLENEIEQNTSLKIDIGCILKSLKRIIVNIESFELTELTHRKHHILPSHYINGYYAVYFKDMGNNYGISNIYFLDMPVFIIINEPEDCKKWIEILEEHYSILVGKKYRNNFFNSPIDETGVGLLLLQNYRNFLTTGDIESLLMSLSLHSVFISQECASFKESEFLKRKMFIYQNSFSIQSIEQLFKLTKDYYMKTLNKPLSPIFQNEGFKNFAAAIRKSTISLFYNPRLSDLYDVRYGLAQDLKRKSSYRDELIQYLSEFASSFNNENTRVFKNKKVQLRSNITAQDIENLIAILDEYGSNLIGKLLCAYGYALDRKEKIDNKNSEPSLSTDEDNAEEV